MTRPCTNGMIGWPVQDGLRRRLGHLASLYVDVDGEESAELVPGGAAESETARFAGVAMLRRGRRRIVFVSLAGATVESACITLACGGQLVRSAPNVQVGRPLPADAEAPLFAHYGLRYNPSSDGARRLVPLK
jgi:hypothetical protein